MENNGLITILLIIILTIFLLFSTLVFPDFSLGEVWAQGEEIKPPGTLEEAKEMGEDFRQEAQEKIPGIMERVWEEEAMPVWQKMWDWAKSWWENTAWPWVSNIFQEQVKPPLEKEIEKRKPIIEQELEKEKEEIKKEVPEVGKSLWERFKGLFE